MSAWVRMGVVHAYGLRGELKVVLDNESSTLRWVGLSALLTRRDGRQETRKVRAFRRVGALGYAFFDGITDRTGAEGIEGATISLARADLPELGDDEVYLADVVGLDVEVEGARVGKVERVEIYPSSNALVVRIGERELEVPLHEAYVREVDLRERVVRLAQLPELAAEDRGADERGPEDRGEGEEG